MFISVLGVVEFACALRVFPILCPKPVGIPEPAGLACTITLGARWDTYDWQIEMAALSNLGIGCNERLAVRAQQVAPWVAPSVAPPVALPVGTACVGHWCSVTPAMRAHQVVAPAPLELVVVLHWQGFAPLELAATTLEFGNETWISIIHMAHRL